MNYSYPFMGQQQNSWSTGGFGGQGGAFNPSALSNFGGGSYGAPMGQAPWMQTGGQNPWMGMGPNFYGSGSQFRGQPQSSPMGGAPMNASRSAWMNQSGLLGNAMGGGNPLMGGTTPPKFDEVPTGGPIRDMRPGFSSNGWNDSPTPQMSGVFNSGSSFGPQPAPQTRGSMTLDEIRTGQWAPEAPGTNHYAEGISATMFHGAPPPPPGATRFNTRTRVWE